MGLVRRGDDVHGHDRKRRAASLLLGLTFVGTLWFTVDGHFPPFAVTAALVLAGGSLLAWRRGSGPRATRQLVITAGLALALLAVAVLFTPFADVPLPDIGVLGPYTYLATEIAFGTLALALLVRAGRDAVRRSALTVAVLYPLAYVWDWYTLEVGVFAIPLRTGIELFGIPLEEHVFMLVVPALVLAIHETLHDRDSP